MQLPIDKRRARAAGVPLSRPRACAVFSFFLDER
jgi:hypothetical protein